MLVGAHRHRAGRRLDEAVEQRRGTGAAEVEQLQPQLVLPRAQVLGEVVGLQPVLVDLRVRVEASLAAASTPSTSTRAGPLAPTSTGAEVASAGSETRVENATTELLTGSPAARRNSGRA